MFRPVAFEPHGRRKKHRGVPRWLVLLATGLVTGAGGLWYVQERLLPPRLSAEASRRLTASFEQADADRRQLQQQLADATRSLQATQAERDRLVRELQDGRQATAQLREELAALVAELPPDPRAGAVQVRAARFSADAGQLAYDVALSRGRAGSAPLNAVMQLVVAGSPGKGAETSLKLPPVSLSMQAFESLKGRHPLPSGFAARQVTVQVLDRAGGKLLGLRVLPVK